MENSLQPLEKRWSILHWKDQDHSIVAPENQRNAFETILSHLPLNLLLFDSTLTLVYSNRKFPGNLRANPVFLKSRTFEEVLPPSLEGRSLLKKKLRWSFKRKGKPLDGFLTTKSTGDIRTFHYQILSLMESGPNDPYAMVLLDEVTEQLSLQRTLNLEGERLKEIFDGMSVGLVILNQDLEMEMVNQSARSILGRSAKSRIPREFFPVQVAETFSTGKASYIPSYPVERTGIQRIFEIHSFPLKDRRGKVVRVIECLRDITEERKNEENLRNMKELASVGQIAAGLAHELGNPLGIIAGTAQFCLQNRKIYDGLSRSFEVILRNAQNADRVIRELLNYTRPSETHFVITQLPLLVKRALLLIETEIKKKKIKIDESHSGRLSSIRADEHQIVQVFVNLLLNSIEACPSMGRISIHTSLPERGEKVIIHVQDDGPGFPEEYLGRAFDPFFTTRPRGTGLGLSICEKIILTHGGTIAVSNRNGKGATVVITLPLIH